VIAALLALALTAADPCGPVAPAADPDALAAAEYRAVGDQELAAAHPEAASVAYRAAAALGDSAARSALARLCAARGPAQALRRGLAQMDAGDCRAAAASFAEARAADPNPSAALLEGICRYELGEDEPAARCLREAEANASHREEARFYLGLLALRAGEGAEASSLFEAARSDPALADSADALARRARLEGRWTVALSAESGWDSNVTLAPSGLAAAPPQADALYALSGAVLFRPDGARGPYLRASGFLRDPVQLGAYSVRGVDGAAGWQLMGDTARGVLEYDFAWRTFGGAPYLGAHRLLASGDVRAGPAVLGAAYLVRFDSYATGWTDFSGTLQRGEVRAGFSLAPWAAVTIAYGLGRDATRDPVLSYLEHGPRAEVRLALSRTVRGGVEAAMAWRGYDRSDPALGTLRRDVQLDAAAFLELELASGLRARLSLDARRTSSSAPAAEYGKIVPALGMTYARGL
jgi:tetratricopeptide (TPR) repeat protein